MPNIAFSQVSPHRRRPLFTAEVDASRANSARSTFRSVLAAGNDGVNTTLTNFEPVRVFSESDVAARAGVGSTLHLMARHFFAANPDGEVFVHPIEVSGAAQPGRKQSNLIGFYRQRGGASRRRRWRYNNRHFGRTGCGLCCERHGGRDNCRRCLRCTESTSHNFAIL